MRRWIPVLLCAAPLLLFGRAAAAEPTGQQLSGYFGHPGSWGMMSPDDRDLRFQIDGGYRFIDREFHSDFGDDESFTSHELGITATVDYKRFWLSGSFFHSIATEELEIFDTDTSQWSVSAGYRFSLGKNLDLSPVIGFSYVNTEIDEFGNDFDRGYGGLNIGFNAKWTPGYKASKPFPRFSIYGGFLYYPDLKVTDDLDDAGFEGDDGWVASIGAEYNWSARLYTGLYYQYAEYNADRGPVFSVGQRDHRVGVNTGFRF